MLMSVVDGAGGPGPGGNAALIGSERGNCQAYELDDIATQIRH